MAMVYTLVTSAKEWLSERYSQDTSNDNAGEEEVEKEDVWLCVLYLWFHYTGYRFTKFKYIDNFVSWHS